MDVPGAAAPTPPPVVSPALSADGTPPPSQPPGTPPVPGPSGSDTSTVGSAGAVHAATGTDTSPRPPSEDTTLKPMVAKLFNAAQQDVEVSFRVETNPDEVVTVFTDKSTGKEIIQFPSQTLIALAEMIDKHSGKVLDKSV